MESISQGGSKNAKLLPSSQLPLMSRGRVVRGANTGAFFVKTHYRRHYTHLREQRFGTGRKKLLRNRLRRASESHLLDEDIKSISRGELVHFGIKDWQTHLLSYKLASFSELLHRLPTHACNYLAA